MAAPIDVSIEIDTDDGTAPHTVECTAHAADPESLNTPSIEVDWGDGSQSVIDAEETATHTFSSPGRYTIRAVASLGDDSTDADEPVVVTVAIPNRHPNLDNDGGVCEPWITVDDLCQASVGDGTRDALLAQAAVNEATRWLNDATLNRWAGPCTALLRPNPICEPARAPGLGSGRRRSIDLSLWVLPPIRSIVEIRVDGEVIDSKWAYLDGNRLVASTGWDDDDSPLIPWPTQNEDRQAGAPDTWDLTVIHGSGPPEPLRRAAQEFACELLYAACGDDRCSLPKTAVSVSRDNVTMTFQPPVKGRTGLPLVDNAIDLYGPEGLGAPPRRILDPADTTRVQVSRY